MRNQALLALADGSVFQGESIGIDSDTVGEVVFNTSMTGYQEILTDPSYCKQIVTLTYPHIGNVGVNEQDDESGNIQVAGLVIKDLSVLASNWRHQESLGYYLQQNKKVAIAGIDTRRLTRILRAKGAQNGCIMAGANIDQNEAIARARDFPGLEGMDLAKQVTTDKVYQWAQGSWSMDKALCFKHHAPESLPYHVVAYDFGVKRNILRMLVDRGCLLTVVPATTPAEEVLKMNPDGVFLSNGPGDPEPCDYAINAIIKLMDHHVPLFGICLGHQLLALASHAKTMKMKFGHHGANHPVLSSVNGVVMISSQNHGFAVDEDAMPKCIEVTHRSLFDQSIQGVRRTDKPAFGFQGHPEASPGPHDAASLFDQFIGLMVKNN